MDEEAAPNPSNFLDVNHDVFDVRIMVAGSFDAETGEFEVGGEVITWNGKRATSRSALMLVKLPNLAKIACPFPLLMTKTVVPSVPSSLESALKSQTNQSYDRPPWGVCVHGRFMMKAHTSYIHNNVPATCGRTRKREKSQLLLLLKGGQFPRTFVVGCHSGYLGSILDC